MFDGPETEGLISGNTVCHCSREGGRREGKSGHHTYGIISLALLLLLAVLAGIQVLQQRQVKALLWSGPIPCQQSEWTEQKIYGQDEQYQSLSHEYDHLWNHEASARNGVITLSVDDNTGEERVGAIGMFHQLHCLASLRSALQRAQEGKQIGIDGRSDKHWPHCLNYLHQAILCAADDTIEMPTLDKQGNQTLRVISGVYDQRKCRNATALYARRAEASVLEEFRHSP